MIIDNNYSTGDILPASWVVDVANEINAHSGEWNKGPYLPLTGGTVTGDLQVNGMTTLTGLVAKPNGSAGPTNPNIIFGTSGVNAQTGFYRNSTGAIQVACEGQAVARFGLGQLTLYNGLQVDGNIQARAGGSAEVVAYGFAGDTKGLGMYSQVANQWLRFAAGGVQRMQINNEQVIVNNGLQVDGQADFMDHLTVAGNLVAKGSVKLTKVVSGEETTTLHPNLFANSNGWLFETTWTPSRMAFAPSELTRDDVLERAETATLPPEPDADDDGNIVNTAEVEAHDTVLLFDVVTALLSEVKDLRQRIAELEAA